MQMQDASEVRCKVDGPERNVPKARQSLKDLKHRSDPSQPSYMAALLKGVAFITGAASGVFSDPFLTSDRILTSLKVSEKRLLSHLLRMASGN
jgi:hypothetical protein